LANASSLARWQDGWPLNSIGRRARPDIAYLLPRHPSEIDRLDVQHYALRAALQGNYVAPVTRASHILDVGSGTGQWAYDLCEEFPGALVVGVDVVPGKPEPPPNYRFVRASLIDGLPFATGSFDFVHQRLMLAAIPREVWPASVAELLRVARPGGLVELFEIGDRVEPMGPATRRLFELMDGRMALLGLAKSSVVLRSLTGYLHRAGAVEVERRAVAVPIGSWGGTIGSMMATDVRALFTRLREPFERSFGVGSEAFGDLLAAAMDECESHQSNAVCTIAYGRKPEPA
jgi:SAM-dependent methyltransferase